MNLAATMSLNAGAFSGPLNQVRASLGGVLGQLRNLGPAITLAGAAFAGFRTAQAAVREFMHAFDEGAGLAKLSRMTGESVKDLTILQRAFELAEVPAANVQGALVMLQKSLGGVNEQGQPTKVIFDQLGLSIHNLQQLSAPEQFARIGEKLRALPSAAQRTAAAMAIFGRSGAEMLAVLNDPDAMSDALRDASQLGAIYQRNAQVFARVGNTISSIKTQLATLWAGIAEGAAPLFNATLEWVRSLNLSQIGADIGRFLNAIPNAFRQGKLSEMLSLTLQVGFAKGINYFTAGMTAVVNNFGALFSAQMEVFRTIPDVLVGAAGAFGGAMLKALTKPLSYVQATFEKIFNPTDRTPIAEIARKIQEEGGPRFGFGFGSMTAGDIMKESQSQFGGGLGNMAKAISNYFTQMGSAFRGIAVTDITGAGELSKKLSEMIAGLIPETAELAAAAKQASGPGLAATAAGRIESDRLAKIGGFIGGAGGPALDYARRTAIATERMLGVIKHLTPGSPEITPAYA
ncbi:MAG: hypothetical protein HZA93_23955 [Verrucomicrobia bacterium]|nr:hypothetical protein [Verrucomicrobiota bacterium]